MPETSDSVSDHSSFRRVEGLSITWLDLGDFKPGSFARHVHYGSSPHSLRLSYLCADFSALITFLQLFLNLLSFDSASSPFLSHLADFDLRFSSVSSWDCNFSSGFPLARNLLAIPSQSRTGIHLVGLNRGLSATSFKQRKDPGSSRGRVAHEAWDSWGCRRRTPISTEVLGQLGPVELRLNV